MHPIFFAVLMQAASATQPSVDTLPPQQAIPAMTQQLLDALPGDRSVWERYLSDRAVYVAESGAVATKAELLKAFGPFPEGMRGSIAVRNPQVTEFGDVAICVFEAHEKQQVFDQQIEVNYRSTHTWHREDGRWRLIAAMNGVVAKDPSPLAADRSRWKNYTGTYQLGGKRRYVVEQRGDDLFGGPEGGTLVKLIPLSDSVFAESANPLGVLRIFPAEAGGGVTRMVQRRKFADVTWTRVR